MRKSLLTIVAIIALVAAWSILLSYVPPTEIVGMIGAQNSLLVAFLVAAFGGMSTLTSVNFYAVVLTLASGGTNTLALGVCAGVGVTVGDMLFYYLGTQGHDLLSGKALEIANRIEVWVNQKHEAFVQALVVLYTGFTPLPNDLLTVPLGLAEYSYKRLLPALIVGNIILTTIVAEFAVRSQLVQKLFGL